MYKVYLYDICNKAKIYLTPEIIQELNDVNGQQIGDNVNKLKDKFKRNVGNIKKDEINDDKYESDLKH